MLGCGSTGNEQGLGIMVRGHKGNIYLGSNHCVVRPERLFVDDFDEETIKAPNVRAQDELRLDWLRCVRTREENVSQVDLATKIMVIVDLATRSIWEGSAFEFDPNSETVKRC